MVTLASLKTGNRIFWVDLRFIIGYKNSDEEQSQVHWYFPCRLTILPFMWCQFAFFIPVLAIIFYIQVTALRILQLLIFEFNILIGQLLNPLVSHLVEGSLPAISLRFQILEMFCTYDHLHFKCVHACSCIYWHPAIIFHSFRTEWNERMTSKKS